MRIVVLDANYPHDNNLYGDVFVHVRVARYLELGHDVRVISFFNNLDSYTFDGVDVECAPDLSTLQRLISEFRPDVVALHFFQGWMLRKLILTSAHPFVIWVHGIEALGWYRRLFNLKFSKEFADYVAYNTIQMWRFRKLVMFARKMPQRVKFVFVSEWMRRIAESDSLTSIPEYSVIPNPIDTDRFPYIAKESEQRHRVLLVRSFDSRKYANDIAVKAIQILSQRPEFDAFSFSIYGTGRFFEMLTRPLRSFANVSINEGFLTQAEIRELHATHGVMLCPTRQDAQGVTMCEAMSSGLVPLSSRSSAIPEFVDHNVTGFLTSSATEIADAMLKLHADESLFHRMSRAAASSIRQKSGIQSVVNDEIAVMAAAAS